MASILNRTWTIKAATISSPFRANKTLKITATEVFHDGISVASTATGATFTVSPTKVTVLLPAADEYWEFVGSATMFRSRFVLYVMSWMSTTPDAMGAWVCEPQTDP